jgi:hypothetical protein
VDYITQQGHISTDDRSQTGLTNNLQTIAGIINQLTCEDAVTYQNAQDGLR